MSNRAFITSTHFVNPVTHGVDYGVRVVDDYGHGFIDWWGQEELPDDPMELLKKVLENQDDIIQGIFDFVYEEQNGVYINDVWYGWEQISPVLESSYEDDDEEGDDDDDEEKE